MLLVNELRVNRLVKYLKCAISWVMVIALPILASAQEKYSNGILTGDEGNFSSFSTPKTGGTQEQWDQHNAPQFKNHPEYGKLPKDAPQANVIEVLSKRTANQRFFINPEGPSEFYQQTSYGPMHYDVNGQWISINSSLQEKGSGIYEASHQSEPVGFDIHQKHSYIKTVNGTASFNNWNLYGVKNGIEQLLAQADWTNYTAGDNGLYITNVFPGIDLKMRVHQGSVKADFVVKSIQFHSVDYLLFKDTFGSSESSSSIVQMANSPTEFVTSNGSSLLTIGDAVIYPEGASKEEVVLTEYRLEQNKLGIAVSYNWLLEKTASGNVIIDPLVTSSNFMAQAAITGSQYNGSCDFTNSCDFNLPVTPPANATITNITTTLDYIASGICWREDGAMRFGLANCLSPSQLGYFWFCNIPSAGLCTGTNVPIWADVSSCAPAASCNPVPAQFILKFYRSCYGNVGCTSGCISAASNWSVTIQGYTLQYSSTNPTQQITLSATTVCQGGSVTATSNSIQYGVPPYTVNWSLSSTGTPSIGTGNSVPVTLNTIGANVIYCTVTDACGNSITSNRTVTVTAPAAGPVVVTPVNYCLNELALPLTAPGTNLRWYTTPTGGTFTAAPTPSTNPVGTTSYYVSQMVGNCESLRSQIDVIVNPLPVITGTPVITPSACVGATGGISGLTSSAPQPITYVWLNSSNVVVSSSTSTSTLSNQPAGTYTLNIEDANGCQSSQGGYVIPNENSPILPIVTSPVTYCQDDVATALTAGGTGLLWYTTAAGGTGSATAPVPVTASAGTTSYFVSQISNGCESLRAEIVVDVNPTPAAPTVTTPVSYCMNQAASALQATGSDLLWYTTPTGGTGSSATPLVNTTSAATLQFYVSQTLLGCESPRANIAVTINPNPVVSGNPVITPSNCNSSTGAISGLNVSDGITPYTYIWQNASGNNVGTTIDISNQAIGAYTLLVTDQNQCSVTHGPLTIAVANTPPFPQSQTPIGYCLAATAAPLTATGNNILWYANATGGVGSNTAPTPVTTTVGQFFFYVTQNINGCESERKEIVVNVIDAPGADFVSAQTVGCAPYCANFQNLSTSASSTIVASSWSANGENFSSETNPQHCFPAGTYEIALEVTDAVGCTRQVVKDNYIVVVPAPQANFTADKEEAPEENATITFTSTNPSNNTVIWSYGDGSSDTAHVATHTFAAAGRYCVTQTIISPYGCSDQTELCVLITPDFYLYIPNSFTPTGDGINDVWKPEIKGRFHSYRLSIYNRWGEAVFQTNDPDTYWVGDVANGDYFFAPDGFYQFVIVIEDINRNPKEYRGHVQILR